MWKREKGLFLLFQESRLCQVVCWLYKRKIALAGLVLIENAEWACTPQRYSYLQFNTLEIKGGISLFLSRLLWEFLLTFYLSAWKMLYRVISHKRIVLRVMEKPRLRTRGEKGQVLNNYIIARSRIMLMSSSRGASSSAWLHCTRGFAETCGGNERKSISVCSR